LADGEAKPDVEKNPGEVATEHNMVLREKIEAKTEAGTSS
jgi:hypothetical protein